VLDALPAHEGERRFRRELRDELIDDGRLADTRLAREEHDLPVAIEGSGEARMELAAFIVPPDEQP
jgi:hypothetical protein